MHRFQKNSQISILELFLKDHVTEEDWSNFFVVVFLNKDEDNLCKL